MTKTIEAATPAAVNHHHPAIAKTKIDIIALDCDEYDEGRHYGCAAKAALNALGFCHRCKQVLLEASALSIVIEKLW